MGLSGCRTLVEYPFEPARPLGLLMSLRSHCACSSGAAVARLHFIDVKLGDQAAQTRRADSRRYLSPLDMKKIGRAR
jgi:hypothetical protein